MKFRRFVAFNLFPVFFLLTGNPASATLASVRGSIGAVFNERAGDCNKFVKEDPIRQDFLGLSLSAPCSNGAVGGDLRADASTASVGFRVTASGTGVVSGSVYLSDEFILTPPPGTTVGNFAIPATFQVKGEVAKSTKVQDAPFFLMYTLAFRGDFLATPKPYYESGFITVADKFSETKNVELNASSYWGPQNYISGYYSLELSVPLMFEGTIDFSDATFMSISLPKGWTGKTSSGLTLTSPIPEPSSALLLALGLGFVARGRLNRLALLRSGE